jgi:hypothetical protein
MGNFTKNKKSFYYFFHICIPVLLELNKVHMNQCDTIFCINGFRTIKTFHNYFCIVESDQYKLFFVFQLKIQLYYAHKDSILVCMDLVDKAHIFHHDIFFHMNAFHNLIKPHINFSIFFFYFHKTQHFFLFYKNIQMSIQFNKDHMDLHDIFYRIHEQDNSKVYHKNYRN